MALPEIVIGSKLDAKGFKQAESAVSKLTKSVRNLAAAFGIALGGRALLNYSKQAVKAFAADEKAARSLALALANTGNAFRGIEVEKFIGDLQRTTGVLDDNLRPAFRTLLTATGDVTKSQEGLKLALDIAAGTGKDLGAVSMALSKAYGGQTTALSRLGAGLDKATLASGDMDLITGELSKKFSGQALTAAEGYSGQMDRLTVASNNAKEIIGKDLLDSLNLLSGPGGISKSTTQMEDLAKAIGDTVYGLALLIDKVKSIPGASFIMSGFGEILTNLQPFAGLRNLGRSSKATPAQSPGERKQIDKINKDALKFQKQQNDLAKIDIANTTRKLVLTADQQALEELKKKFDIDRIQINAALNENIDKETRLRLQSLLAIHDNDAALAGKIKAEIEASKAVGDFAGAARAAAELLRTSYSAGLSSFKQSEFDSLASSANAGITAPNTSTSSMPSPLDYGTFGAGTFRAAEAATTNIQVNVAGSVTTAQDLVSAITQGIYNNQASGIPISYTTAFR
jgi:hypothetical protein